MRDEIIDIFINFYEGEEEIDIDEESSIMEDLEFSSLEFFSLVSAIEEAYGIKITERELQSISTVGDMIDLVESKA